MIAVVSYANETLCHDLLIKDNDLADQENGRGISVVGGRGVTIQGNRVARTNCCAGIYIAGEASYNTHGVDNVLVQANLLIDNSGYTGHGAIMIFADQRSVHDIRVERNMIKRSRHAGITLKGSVNRIEIIGNSISESAGPAIDGDGTKAYCRANFANGVSLTSPFCGGSDDVKAPGASLVLNPLELKP